MSQLLLLISVKFSNNNKPVNVYIPLFQHVYDSYMCMYTSSFFKQSFEYRIMFLNYHAACYLHLIFFSLNNNNYNTLGILTLQLNNKFLSRQVTHYNSHSLFLSLSLSLSLFHTHTHTLSHNTHSQALSSTSPIVSPKAASNQNATTLLASTRAPGRI